MEVADDLGEVPGYEYPSKMNFGFLGGDEEI